MKNDEQREAMELIAKHIFDMFYKIKQVAATHAALKDPLINQP